MAIKILSIISAVLLLAAGFLGYLNYKESIATKAALKETSATLAKRTEIANKLEIDKKNLTAELKTETEKRQSVEAELATTKTQLSEATTKIDELNKTIADKEKIIADTKKALDEILGQGGNVEDLKAKLEATNARLKELETQVAAVEGEKKILQEKLTATQAEVAALQKAEADRKNALMRKGLEGLVMAYNPSWNFVVLNIGDRQGVAAGGQLVIMRGSQMIGKVKVSSVEPSTAIADVVLSSLAPGAKIQPGDRVIVPRS